MPKSILRNPPAGSELAARLAAIKAAGEGNGDFPDMLLHIREVSEMYRVRAEPRTWKLPPELIARHDLPARIAVMHGEGAEAEFARTPWAMQLLLARYVQELDYHTASAQERTKEPPPDHMPVVRGIITAEFMNVCSDAPGGSLNRHYMETARRLGGRGARINRAAVRRAVADVLRATRHLSEQERQLLAAALAATSDCFLPGWRQRMN